jgi:AcrR family transcriptional regulator
VAVADTGTSEARAAILSALERLLQEHPLDAVSVAQVLGEAGVSRATFYFYFSSKDNAFVALLTRLTDVAIPAFEALLGDVERRRTRLREDMAAWLAIEPPHQAVLRNAVEEWPRRPELRDSYLAAHGRLCDALRRAIDEDREAGVAAPGIASAQLAAGWACMAERSWYGAVGGEEHLELAAVREALASTLVAAVYGR